MEYDYAIIGGGVIGNAIARELCLRKLGSVLLLEKEAGVGKHTSGRNSGVIHSGFNQKPGTLKSKLCVQGNELLRAYCIEKQIPHEVCGTIVVARNSREMGVLEVLLQQGG